MLRPQPSKQTLKQANTRRNSAKVEQYLTQVEKSHGWAKSWEIRERLEKGDTTLKEVLGY